jgi:hypothetical protein
MGILDKYFEAYQKDQEEIAPTKDVFVTNVACTREVENHVTSFFSAKNKKANNSFARASNKCDKLAGCDNCPAAGYWDYTGPGRWCFHTAYFLGKSGKPTPCETAQHNCPLKQGNQ